MNFQICSRMFSTSMHPWPKKKKKIALVAWGIKWKPQCDTLHTHRRAKWKETDNTKCGKGSGAPATLSAWYASGGLAPPLQKTAIAYGTNMGIF